MQTILEISYLRLYFNVFIHVNKFESVQFSSVTQSCPILCYPMDCSTAGLPVCNNLLEFTEKSFANLQRNFLDLTEAEGIKKRQQEYTEEVYKKDLNDLDNHDDVITHLEPDIDLNQGPTPWSPLLPVPVLQRRTKTEPSKDSNTLLSKQPW